MFLHTPKAVPSVLSSHTRSLAPEVLFSWKRMGFKRVEKNRRSPDAISPEGTGQSVARHGSAGKHFSKAIGRSHLFPCGVPLHREPSRKFFLKTTIRRIPITYTLYR